LTAQHLQALPIVKLKLINPEKVATVNNKGRLLSSLRATDNLK
jgi:hypothetical protein